MKTKFFNVSNKLNAAKFFSLQKLRSEKSLELWAVIPTIDYGMLYFLEVLEKCNLLNIATSLEQAINSA